jgi:hypothetical protein
MEPVYADDFGQNTKKKQQAMPPFYRGAVCTGGVSTNGGRGFGFAAGPGAGRISIGGGSGATC